MGAGDCFELAHAGLGGLKIAQALFASLAHSELLVSSSSRRAVAARSGSRSESSEASSARLSRREAVMEINAD
jgi:hypothetical protein